MHRATGLTSSFTDAGIVTLYCPGLSRLPTLNKVTGNQVTGCASRNCVNAAGNLTRLLEVSPGSDHRHNNTAMQISTSFKPLTVHKYTALMTFCADYRS